MLFAYKWRPCTCLGLSCLHMRSASKVLMFTAPVTCLSSAYLCLCCCTCTTWTDTSHTVYCVIITFSLLVTHLNLPTCKAPPSFHSQCVPLTLPQPLCTYIHTYVRTYTCSIYCNCVIFPSYFSSPMPSRSSPPAPQDSSSLCWTQGTHATHCRSSPAKSSSS